MLVLYKKDTSIWYMLVNGLRLTFSVAANAEVYLKWDKYNNNNGSYFFLQVRFLFLRKMEVSGVDKDCEIELNLSKYGDNKWMWTTVKLAALKLDTDGNQYFSKLFFYCESCNLQACYIKFHKPSFLLKCPYSDWNCSCLIQGTVKI